MLEMKRYPVIYTEGADYGDGNIVWEDRVEYAEKCEFFIEKDGSMWATIWPNPERMTSSKELVASLQMVRKLKLSPADAIQVLKTNSITLIESYGEPVEMDGKQAQRYERIEMTGWIYICVGNRVNALRAVEKKRFKKLWLKAAKEMKND